MESERVCTNAMECSNVYKFDYKEVMIMRYKSIKILSVILLSNISSITFAQANNENIIYKKLVLKATKEKVWSALTNKNELGKWWNSGVRLEPYEGGQFYEPWGDGQLATGKVIELKMYNFIKFTWQEKCWNSSEKTLCKLKLRTNGGTTILEVNHSGWKTFKEIDNRKKLIEGFKKGWGALLPKLKKYVESDY